MDRARLTKHWHWETDRDGLAWLTFDKQGESANTFSREALEQLSAALEEIRRADPKGLVIRSAKEGFIAGADVEEFTRFKSPAEAMSFVRLGWDAFQALRELPFPTTAMVNGFCMGGGVELALACRYRVALDEPKTRFALPEVMLGIMPAWHGVQWLPKLVGPAAAFDMLLTGKSVDARRAQRSGLVDQAMPLRILENTARIITLETPKRKSRSFWKTMLLSGPLRTFVVFQARRQVARKAKREHYPAPYAILELWKRFDGDPFRAAGDPAASVEALFAHPTTANLIRIFFLQERLKSLGKAADFEPRYVHIVGAGVMGGDIAAICAMRGLPVTLQDTAPEPIASGRYSLFQPGSSIAAGRDRLGREDKSRAGKKSRGFRSSDRQAAAAGKGRAGISRQPRARAVHVQRVPHARPGREARDARPRDGRLRHADGPGRARRHRRARHLPGRREGAGEEILEG